MPFPFDKARALLDFIESSPEIAAKIKDIYISD